MAFSGSWKFRRKCTSDGWLKRIGFDKRGFNSSSFHLQNDALAKQYRRICLLRAIKNTDMNKLDDMKLEAIYKIITK